MWTVAKLVATDLETYEDLNLMEFLQAIHPN